MPKIRVYANYEFTNDSDDCNDNGKLSMLYEVPKTWNVRGIYVLSKR